MLNILVNPSQGLSELKVVWRYIQSTLHLINRNEFDEANGYLQECLLIIGSLKEKAIQNEDESNANALFVVNSYIKLIQKYTKYWVLLRSEKYRESWGALQDCLDHLRVVSRFTNWTEKFHLDFLWMQLKELEKLYPFKVFSSIEMMIEKEKCSVCGKPSTDLDCVHIRGELYNGELAHSIVEKGKLLAVALVKNPMDKRCVVEVSGDNRSEEEKFKLLHFFNSQVKVPLQAFGIVETTRDRSINEFKDVGRNERCPCGSTKKFKNCCINKNSITTPHTIIQLGDPLIIEYVKGF